jgi:hypothetical protein
MGGGGLRILPHKSWNVYNYDNRLRVEQDEKQAQKEEEEKRIRFEEAVEKKPYLSSDHPIIDLSVQSSLESMMLFPSL